jgi:hypothetical protein
MQPEKIKGNDDKSFIPFFVADRQASLRILSGLKIPRGKRFGLMTHANVYKNFQKGFKKFPCINPDSCAVIGNKKCPFNELISKCKLGNRIRRSLVTICDSGIFTKDGCGHVEYPELFRIYKLLSVDYGIIIDYLKNKEDTLQSAEDALKTYKLDKWSFRLMGVAQGNTIDEYIECYKELKKIGYDFIGIGGMLRKKEKSARYVYVRDETMMSEIFSSIRKFDKNGKIFALGCYSPARQELFRNYSIFGSDYKGWIFQYSTKSDWRGEKKAQRKRFREVRQFIEKNILNKEQEYRNNRLLIISCSKTKKEISNNIKIQAINLYDGPVYRVLRKHIRNFDNNNDLNILIISAKYGLIQPMDKILKYDQFMTPIQAERIKIKIKNQFSKIIYKKNYSDILVNLSSEYLKATSLALGLLSNTNIIILNGRIGKRLRETKQWILKK